jgi:hypothetical protein
MATAPPIAVGDSISAPIFTDRDAVHAANMLANFDDLRTAN